MEPKCNSTNLPPDIQAFKSLISSFLDELDDDERVDAMIAYQRFVEHFPTSEQAESLVWFWRSYPGFHAHEMSTLARQSATLRLAPTAASGRSNAGPDRALSAWEARSYACHAGTTEHTVSVATKLTKHRRHILTALAEGGYINVEYVGGGYKEYYRLTQSPDFWNKNVTTATIEFFKANGWIEEVDGNFSGSVYVITEVGRAALGRRGATPCTATRSTR